jgi:glycosyltransferase involved in cell wall biosynthesis
MRRIKVAMLGLYLEEVRKYSTIAIHTNKLTKYISHMEDIELHIITIGNENMQFEEDDSNVHVIKKSTYYPLYLPGAVMLLKRKIVEINPDVVHAQGTFTPYSTAMTLVCKKYPTLLSVRGIVAKELKFYRGLGFISGALIEKANEKYALSKIPNIIVTSPHSKDVIRSMTSSKIYVIPNGIDFDEIQKIRTEDRLKHPAILVMSTLGRVKGIDVLLNAIPIIRKEIPNLHVYIAGKSGSEEGNLKKLVKALNIEESVSFLGFISGNEKYIYYKSADIYVQPSRYETFGVVLLEAMACGKPVVASNVGGIPFVVENGKTGLLFESENVDELAEKIMFLLKDDELRTKMGEAGRKRARGFTWERSAEMTAEVYREVIENEK